MSHAATEELEALKNELLGTVSHELRTPLAAISGNIALLLQYEALLPPAEQHECLTEIAHAAQRLSTAITLLLDVGRFTNNGRAIQRQPVEMTCLARDEIADAQAQASALGQSLRFAAPQAEESQWVRGDAVKLRQSLHQLLLNAMQHTPAGGVITLAVQACQVASGAGIAFVVQDTGCGIAPEHLPHLCERFYRVDTRLDREVNGLGLGLALCQYIAHAHGGEIHVESSVSVGSTFHMCLPRLARH